MPYEPQIVQQARCAKPRCQQGACGVTCMCACHDYTSLYLNPAGGFTPLVHRAAVVRPYATAHAWKGAYLMTALSDMMHQTVTAEAALNARRIVIALCGFSDTAVAPGRVSLGLDTEEGVYLGFHLPQAHLVAICADSGAIVLLTFDTGIRAYEVANDADVCAFAVEEIHSWLKRNLSSD